MVLKKLPGVLIFSYQYLTNRKPLICLAINFVKFVTVYTYSHPDVVSTLFAAMNFYCNALNFVLKTVGDTFPNAMATSVCIG